MLTAGVKELLEQYVHENVGLKNPDGEMDLNYVRVPQTQRKIEYVLNNSLAFGGQNAALVIKRYVN